MSPECTPTDIDREKPAGRRRHGGRRAQADSHLHGCVARLFGVVVAAEEEEQGVAAELEQLAASGRRDARASARTPG